MKIQMRAVGWGGSVKVTLEGDDVTIEVMSGSPLGVTVVRHVYLEFEVRINLLVDPSCLEFGFHC